MRMRHSHMAPNVTEIGGRKLTFSGEPEPRPLNVIIAECAQSDPVLL